MDVNGLKQTLCSLVRKAIEARFNGVDYATFSQTRGYLDGYMRALLDAELFGQGQLLELVNTERRRYENEAQDDHSGSTRAA